MVLFYSFSSIYFTTAFASSPTRNHSFCFHQKTNKLEQSWSTNMLSNLHITFGCHRWSISEMETSLLDHWGDLVLDSSDSVNIEAFINGRIDVSPCKKNAGFEGAARVTEYLLSIIETWAIVGLRASFSWTQTNPMLMHLIISLLGPMFKVGSIMSKGVPSFNFLHDCKNLDKVHAHYSNRINKIKHCWYLHRLEGPPLSLLCPCHQSFDH